MKGATKVGVWVHHTLAVVYDDHPDWPNLCNEDCPQLRRSYGYPYVVCGVFGDLRALHTPGKSRYARDERCIQLGPIYRCKRRKNPPGDGGIVDGCGWQGPRPRDEACPSCGSTMLREVKT